MTVHGFWPNVVGRKGAKDKDGTGKTTHYLSDAAEHFGLPEGREKAVVAVDISILLYNGVKKIDAAREFDVKPRIPVTSVRAYLSKCHAQLLRADIVPVYVFDGQRNPWKAGTNDGRTAERESNWRNARIPPGSLILHWLLPSISRIRCRLLE